MAEIEWLRAKSHPFSDAGAWSGGVVPGQGDDALLEATGPDYTVTSAKIETVESIQLGANATLNITRHTFTAIEGTGGGANAGTIGVYGSATLSVGGDVDNSGIILLNNVGGSKRDVTTLLIASDTTLSGGGTINLSDSTYNEITVNGATLTNVDNVISGSGLISGPKTGFALVNEAGGVIDATGGANGMVIGPLAGAHDGLTNDGLIESTATAGLALLSLNITGDNGMIVAAVGSHIDFESCSINGQSFSVQSGAAISISSSIALVETPVKSSGTLQVNGKKSQLILNSTLDNEHILAVYQGVLIVKGIVTGAGYAFIKNDGVIQFDSAFNQDVDFGSRGGAGTLVLGESQAYGGVITNFSQKGKGVLDLRDIGFVGAGEATFAGTSKSGVLTATDGTHTANIKLQGNYLSTRFTASSDGHGGTMVVGVSGDEAPAPPHGFTAAMAALGGSAGHAVHLGVTRLTEGPMLSRPHVVLA